MVQVLVRFSPSGPGGDDRRRRADRCARVTSALEGCRTGTEALALVPVVGPTVVGRPRLDEALDGPAAVVIVNAPHGYGKTTGAARWASEAVRRGELVVWVTAPVGEERFSAGRLLACVEQRVADVTGVGPPRPPVAGRTRPPTLTVVVDGVRAAQAGLVEAARAFGARSGARVVLLGSGWSDAHWPLAPWEVELGTADLAWSAADVLAYARRCALALSEHVAHTLATGLAGSPALVTRAVQDLGHEARAHALPGEAVAAAIRRHRALELAKHAPREVADFLLDTCVEPSFDRTDLAGLTVAHRPERLAEQLVAAGILHRHASGPRTVYEYAPLLRRGLVEHARHLDPAGFAARAEERALRHLDDGNVRSAVARVVEARSPGATDRLLGRVWSGVLAGTHGVSFDELWRPVLGTDPESAPARLHLLRGTLRSVAGRVVALEPYGDGREPRDAGGEASGAGAEVREARAPGVEATPDDAVSGTLDAYLRVVNLRRAGMPEAALKVAARLRDGERTDVVGSSLVELQSGVAALYAGFLRVAVASASAAFQGAVASGALALAAAAVELAAVAEACGADTHAATRWLRERDGLPPAPDWWRACAGGVDELVEALRGLEDGDPERATRALGRAASAAEGDLWFVHRHVAALVAELSEDPGPDADLVVLEVARHGASAAGSGSAGRPPLLLAQDLAWLQLAAGRGEAARQVAEQLPASAPARQVLLGRLDLAAGRADDAFHRVAHLAEQERLTIGSRLDGLVVAADALLALGEVAHARTELARALALAGRVGAGLPFRWASPAARAILREAARGDVGQRVGRVLDLVEGARPDLDLVTLPERQQLVLRLLVDGLNGPEIAHELFVSANTVKTQIREIYRRLGVHSRAEAIARAKRLGLVAPGDAVRRRRRSPRHGAVT